MVEKSFKERVRLELMAAAIKYKQIYVDYEYLICSESFVQNNYYIIAGKEDNFQHLTGVHTNLKPKEFYFKCIREFYQIQTLILLKLDKMRSW